jgi:cytochrome c-type biogenesis protein
MIETGQFPLVASFVAGIATFISPCVLPLIPVYMSFITGASLDALKKHTYAVSAAVRNAVMFVLGFTVVFVLLGASASFLGGLISEKKDLLRLIGGIVVILFGLHIAGVIPLKFLYYEKHLPMRKMAIGYLGSFLVGCVFAIGWTPCIGPILSSILILASTQETVYQGMLLLTAYSLGLGIPFILTAVFMNWMLRFVTRAEPLFHAIKIGSGVLLVLVGLLLVTNTWQIVSGYLGSLFGQ